MTLGERLKAAREARGWTEEELARRASVQLETLKAIEAGASLHPHRTVVARVCQVLGLPVERVLLEWVRERKKKRAV